MSRKRALPFKRHIRLNGFDNTHVVEAAVAQATGLRPMSVDFDGYQNRLTSNEHTSLMVRR